MIRQDPILIASPPRSGTTMLAAILNAHGVWVGRGRTTRYPETNMNFASENLDIKELLRGVARNRKYINWNVPIPDFHPIPRIKERIEAFVPEDTPWLVKTSWTLVLWEALAYAFPDARWVFPLRDPSKIIDSMNRHPGMRRHPDEEKNRFVTALLEKTSRVIDAGVRFTYVNVEHLVDGDPETIESLFEFLGMDPDLEKISNIVKPEMLKR